MGPVRARGARLAIVICSLLLAALPLTTANARTTANDCPNGGTIHSGVEPYEDAAMLAPAYQPLADALNFDFSTLPPDVQKMFNAGVAMGGTHLLVDNDASFDQVRGLVSALNVDLNNL